MEITKKKYYFVLGGIYLSLMYVLSTIILVATPFIGHRPMMVGIITSTISLILIALILSFFIEKQDFFVVTIFTIILPVFFMATISYQWSHTLTDFFSQAKNAGGLGIVLVLVALWCGKATGYVTVK